MSRKSSAKCTYRLQLGQLLDRLPEYDGASDVDVEGADQPALRDLHAIVHLKCNFWITDPTEVHLVEKLNGYALPLLAKEEEGLGREDEILQWDALLRLLHCHNTPTTPGYDQCEICGEVYNKNGHFVLISKVCLRNRILSWLCFAFREVAWQVSPSKF